jgi:hypothetical protein
MKDYKTPPSRAAKDAPSIRLVKTGTKHSKLKSIDIEMDDTALSIEKV